MSEIAKRPQFKVAGVATIKHLNVRKEGPEDERILAVDIKLEIKRVDRRLCGYGVMTLTCSVSSIYPTASDVSDLAKMVQDEARVEIECPPDLFTEEGESNAKA